MEQLKTGFTEYTADQLENYAGLVGQNATGATWASLATKVTDVGSKLTALQTAQLSSGPGHGTIVANAFSALAKSLSAFAKAANETSTITDDDRASLGLPTVKAAAHSGAKPDVQLDLKLKHGPVSGTIVGSFKRNGDNIIIFEAQWTLDPNAGPWTSVEPFTNSRHFEIPGLERGKDVWVRVRARNTNGWGDWSDPATIMVT